MTHASLRCTLLLVFAPALRAQTPSVVSLFNRYTERFAPGSLVTVVGTNLAGAIAVQVGGRPAAILAVPSSTLISIQLPVEVAAGPTTLVVTTATGSSIPFDLALEKYAPTVTGFGVACKDGPDGNLAVAVAGGLGGTDPPVPTGQSANPATLARTLEKPTITIDGATTDLIDSILVSWYPGVYQINFRLPPMLGDGAYSGVLHIGGMDSNPATIAVLNQTFTNARWGGAAPESLRSASYCGVLASTRISADPRNPPFSLGGATILVKDAAGKERSAPILSVSQNQIDYIIPAGTATGPSTVTITTANGLVLSRAESIENIAPAIFWMPFTATTDYNPIPIAQLVRVHDGAQTVQPLPAHIDLGPAADEVYLVLYGTGWRNLISLANARVKFSSLDDDSPDELQAPLDYAGPQSQFAGVDQVNIKLPRSLAGSGARAFRLTIDGKDSNGGVLFFM